MSLSRVLVNVLVVFLKMVRFLLLSPVWLLGAAVDCSLGVEELDACGFVVMSDDDIEAIAEVLLVTVGADEILMVVFV
jgi:hypothetical protein